MYQYTEATKVKIDFTIDLENIKPYYNLEEKYIQPIYKINRFYNLKYDFIVLGQDYEIYHLFSLYFLSKDKEEYTKQELDVLYKIIEEAFAIAYLYCENEWNNHYKYIYNSYQVNVKKDQRKTNYISEERIELDEIITIFKIYKNINPSDIKLKIVNDEVTPKNKYLSVGLTSKERLFFAQNVLEKRLESWQSKQLTAAEIELYKNSIGKEFVYGDNHPIFSILKKMNNITSQGIMYLNDIQKKPITLDLEYLLDLQKCIKDNWSWDGRASPLNYFNSLIVKTLNRFIEDKITTHKDKFEKGQANHKLQAIFSVLRILNLIPNIDSYSVYENFDAKENYINEFLRERPNRIKKNK